QVVGGDARQTASVHAELFALELGVPVDPIKREQREHRWMRPAPAHRRVELAAEPACHRPAVPLVEVAEEHPGPGQASRGSDEGAEQPELLAALAQRQAEVAVEDVQRRAVDVEVDPPPAPPPPPPPPP